MTEDKIKNLPDILKNHICTLKKSSFDDCNSINMCESSLKVVDFDKIPNEYSRGKGWANVPKSNDALYINDNGWYFVEFKNGSIDKSEIYRKLYDSVIILISLNIIPNMEFVRTKIEYILVYNSNKYPKIQDSQSRSNTFSFILERAKIEEKLFDIDKFEKYIFKATHTYSKEEFTEKFIKLMEKNEGIA
ncbi:MAG: hypothetical protein WCQ54_08900 [Clostridiaceae bacterium]